MRHYLKRLSKYAQLDQNFKDFDTVYQYYEELQDAYMVLFGGSEDIKNEPLLKSIYRKLDSLTMDLDDIRKEFAKIIENNSDVNL